MQRVVLGQNITLEAEFTDGRLALVDPPTVLVSVLDYEQVERVSNAAPTRLSLGKYAYTYPVPADGPVGAWTIVWDASINGAPAGGQEAFDVVAAGAVTFPPTPPTGDDGFVPLTEVVTALGRPLTDAEQTRAGQLVGQLVRLLERRWNRTLIPRTVVGERHGIGVDGRLNLNRGPAAVVTAIRRNGVDLGGSYWGLIPGETVEVDYTVPGITDAADVVGVVVAAVASALRADAATAAAANGAAAGTGPVKSFSVEGLSISYGDATTEVSGSSSSTGEDDRLTVGSLKGLGRLRRPVLL